MDLQKAKDAWVILKFCLYCLFWLPVGIYCVLSGFGVIPREGAAFADMPYLPTVVGVIGLYIVALLLYNIFRVIRRR